jgi:hypothetical protein
LSEEKLGKYMSCRKINSKLADLILDPASVPVDVRAHVTECADCSAELAGFDATMKVLDEWGAPEPGQYFDSKLFARLRTEEAAARMGVAERVRSWMLFHTKFQMRQWAAAALAAALAIGGGTFALLNRGAAPSPQTSATVRDLQSYDGNQQLFQQLNALDDVDANSPGRSN